MVASRHVKRWEKTAPGRGKRRGNRNSDVIHSRSECWELSWRWDRSRTEGPPLSETPSGPKNSCHGPFYPGGELSFRIYNPSTVPGFLSDDRRTLARCLSMQKCLLPRRVT